MRQVLLVVFSLSELAFGMLVATVFSRAKIAAIVGPLLHFCLLLPRCPCHPLASSSTLAMDMCILMCLQCSFSNRFRVMRRLCSAQY